MNKHEAITVMPRKLAELRGNKGVTQEAVAEALGISNKTISKWENGASLPEAEYIPLLADYFEVSVDELFGRQNRNLTTYDLIRGEYDGLSCHDSVLKSFDLTLVVMRGCLAQFSKDFLNHEYPPKYPLSKYPIPLHKILPGCHRTTLSDDTVFECMFNNDDVNMAVMLFGGSSDFEWMTDKAAVIIPLFEFLADADAMKIVKLIHSQTFPTSFTADFMAKEAGIGIEKTVKLLEKAVLLNLCGKPAAAHLREGVVDIYNAFGSGILLSIMTLAHEYLCGTNNNDSAYNGSMKMIRGDKKS